MEFRHLKQEQFQTPPSGLAVILAAGEGKRLRPLTAALPKCLVPVGKSSFLERSLQALDRASFREVCIVTGYRSDAVEHFLGPLRTGPKIHLCRNADHARTNNAYSLWIALREHAGRPFLLLDGDLLFDGRILEGLLGDQRENVVAVDTNRNRLTPESMKVTIASPDRVLQVIGKEIPEDRADGEFIGMAKFSRQWASRLLETLGPLMKEKKSHSFYYEDCIRRILPSSPPVGVFPVGDLAWVEVDTPGDLREASRLWGLNRR